VFAISLVKLCCKKSDAENSLYDEASQVRAQSASVSGLSFECPKLVDMSAGNINTPFSLSCKVIN
jgi:hypothetical protein